MDDKVRVSLRVRTEKEGSEVEAIIEFDPDEWKEMNDSEIEAFCQEKMLQMVSWDYDVVASKLSPKPKPA